MIEIVTIFNNNNDRVREFGYVDLTFLMISSYPRVLAFSFFSGSKRCLQRIPQMATKGLVK
jgi:hypothetical protein